MKKIKMKDTILSHYQKVHELEMDGITVRVWKPRTMQQLPAYHMREFVCNRAEDYKRYMHYEDQSVWHAGNPDWGVWDAQTVYHCEPRRKTLDIYIAAILVRPFSREAYETYCRMHESIDNVNQRLMLMWDSREFDRINGYDTSYGAYQNQEEVDSRIYRAVNKDNDIADHSPSCYLQIIDEGDEESPVRRCGITLRQTPGGTEFNATNNGKQPFEDYCETPLIQDFAKLYTKFREQYPEVTEMRFYTDELVRTGEEGE